MAQLFLIVVVILGIIIYRQPKGIFRTFGKTLFWGYIIFLLAVGFIAIVV